MYTLGLGGSNHGFSACLMKDGKIVSMTSDERITRKKYGVGLGVKLAQGYSRKYCLSQEGIQLDDVDRIVANDIILPAMYFRMEDKVDLMNHHLAHAYSTYYPSGLDETAIMVLDGVGSKKKVNDEFLYESMTLYNVCNGKFDVIKKQYGHNLAGTDYVENSLGIFYALVTEIIGFGEHEEGKTMGLAPYGTKDFYDKLKKFVYYDDSAEFVLSFDSIEEMLQLKEDVGKLPDNKKKEKICADIAWAGQQILEEVYVGIARYLRKETKCKNLCIAGGVALNSVGNYKIYKEKLFDNLFIQPASGDDGTAIGAAYYGYYSGKAGK
ncbi:MAG: hypothetical protein HDQ99_03730 [Lachnospiraceae bacterium]|nr:hypothetical protein [Lachnospiraceae bacterium]